MKRRLLLAASAASLGLPRIALAQPSPTRIKFNLGWKVEATSAGFLLAQQRGYYRDAGLEVAIDTGNGSAAAISLVAGGAYELASADLATMIEFNANNPTAKLAAVAIMYDSNPNSVIVRKGGPIARPQDFAGKTILGQPFNASRKLFPVFARAQGIDPSSIKWENAAPDIGDTRFVKGDFDAAAYFYFTGLLNLKLRGLMPEQLVVYRFSDHGVRSYGNGFVANQKAMTENPEAVRAFVRASTRGWIDAMADPRAGAAAVKAREPLATEEIEFERLRLIIEGSMRTPETQANGWGAATAARLQATLDETVAAFGLKPGLTTADIFTDRFLPSRADRSLKA